MMRLFIGIALPATVRQALSGAAKAMESRMPGRYVPMENYHITLAFLGETDADGLARARRAMTCAAANQCAVPLALDRPGYFGRRENAILYAGITDWDALARIDQLLRQELRNVGLAFDPKPFRPHITLARHVCILPDILNAPLPPVCFPAKGLTLFHSTRINGVLTYLPLAEAVFPEIS